MFTKFRSITVFASTMLVPSMALASQDNLMPQPLPTTQPEIDRASIKDAQTAVGNARKEAEAARGQLIGAQAEMRRVRSALELNLEMRFGISEAQKATENARAQYEQLSRPVLESVAQRADYREAGAVLAHAQQVATEASARAEARIEERTAAAQAVLSAKAAVAQIENDALGDNPAIVSAKTKYLAAAQHLKDLRCRSRRALYEDQSYLAAKQTVEDAQRTVAAANQNLNATVGRAATQVEARQGLSDWNYKHGLPDPP